MSDTVFEKHSKICRQSTVFEDGKIAKKATTNPSRRIRKPQAMTI